MAIRITRDTDTQVTFEKDTWEEAWFNHDCSNPNLLKQCHRESEQIERIQFDDGRYIGSILYVYFAKGVLNRKVFIEKI